MNILITGGTGFIGSSLCKQLADHNCVVLSRKQSKTSNRVTSLEQIPEDTSFDAIINLAGEPIVDKRWSDKQKQSILDSRLQTTQQLLDFCQKKKKKPAVFISGSAIGYYGIEESDEAIDETASPDTSFSSSICQQWEALALQAQDQGIRTCIIRTGIVLGKNGGALAKMLPAFRLGLGGRTGSGKQWMSWIHIDDIVGIILFCLNNTKVEGVINGTAPQPVRNQAFAKELGAALHRPTAFVLPSALIRLLLGQAGEELLLRGKKIIPAKIQREGYAFTYASLDRALQEITEKK